MNAKLVLALAMGLAAMAVASVIVHAFGLPSARIEIAAILVVWACLSLDTTRAAMCSYAAGYLFDVMGGAPTGLYAFVAMLTFVVCRVVVVVVDVRGPVGFAALCFFIDSIHQLIAHGLIAFFAGRTGPQPAHAALVALPATALFTALAAAAMHPLFQRLDRAFDREESSALLR
ncbi:MAG: hypothetical protein JST54_04880 [Deltaproteobacteria bacterium]|nr:hypothetical protein [Deltaproteobacteria bacterium]